MFNFETLNYFFFTLNNGYNNIDEHGLNNLHINFIWNFCEIELLCLQPTVKKLKSRHFEQNLINLIKKHDKSVINLIIDLSNISKIYNFI